MQKFLRVWNIFVVLLFLWQGITSIFIFTGLAEKLQFPPFGSHKWTGIALIVVLIVHLILNWNWVANNFFKAKKPAK